MKLKISAFLICLFISFAGIAQSSSIKPANLSKKDGIRWDKLKAKGTFPLIKSSTLSGVLPVPGITERADSNMKYKLLISLTNGTKDADKAKDPNLGLAEIARIINLHIAAGIPKKNLEVVIVTHGLAIYTLLTNDAFKKEFKVDNPNVVLINELQASGAKFIACGQAMGFLDVAKESILPSVSIALAAKVALSTYALKGYTLYEIGED